MKYIIRPFVAAGLLGLLAGCSSFLDDPQPQQSLPTTEAFQTASDTETGLIGAYNAAQGSDLFGTNTTQCAELLGDNVIWRGSFPSYAEIFQVQMVADNPEIDDMWQLAYQVNNQANLVIQATETLEDPEFDVEVEAGKTFRNQLRGEALFLRGATMFEIVRFYGLPYSTSSSTDPGVPILTEPVVDFGSVTFPARNTVEEVYNQAIADLTEASNLLPDRVGRGRANRFAALAYLAEIAFMQGRYGDALGFTQTIIDEGGFALTDDANGFFVNEGSVEEIWAVVHTVQDNPGVNGSLPTFHHVNARGGDVAISGALILGGFNLILTPDQQQAIDDAGFSAVDQRVTQLTSNDTFNIEKYEDFATNADDAPIWRYAEVLLMHAEALARENGVTQEAVDLLNQIRNRSVRVLDAEGNPVPNSSDLVSYGTGDFASAEALIDAILLEKRVEMAYEGTRFHDLMRTRQDVKGRPFNDPLLRFPVPQREIDANNNLEQNPGY